MEVTTRELVDRAAAAADMHDNFITPAQWMHWASQENLALALFLARSGWTQNVKTTTITVTGAEAGAFPLGGTAPFLKVLAIVAVHQVRDTLVRPIHLVNSVDFLRQTPGANRYTGDPVEYRATWDQDSDSVVLNFFPEPPAGTVIQVSYVPEPLRLTLETPPSGYASSVKYPMGWDERIVLGMARRALDKEESDSTVIQRQMRELDVVIEEAVWDRILAGNKTVRNRDHDMRGWTTDPRLPAASEWWFA